MYACNLRSDDKCGVPNVSSHGFAEKIRMHLHSDSPPPSPRPYPRTDTPCRRQRERHGKRKTKAVEASILTLPAL